MSDRLLKESDVMRIAFQLPYVVNSAFFDAVKALPSADRPTGEWIPVTERMPDIGELVLITQNRGDGDKTVETAYLTSDGPNDLYWYVEMFSSRETDEVLAWQPLPKPYKGGDTE